MNVTLRLEPKARPISVQIDGGTIEDLLKENLYRLPYKVYCARLNNKVVHLDAPLTDNCEVVFLDMRDPSGKHCYQNSVLSMYMRAVEVVMPGSDVIIENSLNQGIFTSIESEEALTDEKIESIEDAMRLLSAEDVSMDQINQDYNLVVPRTGYIRDFDLKRCRRGLVIRIPEDTHAGRPAPYRDDVNLYNVFEQEREWNTKLGITYLSDLDDVIRRGEINDIIHLSEALHEKNIANLADKITESRKRIILIAGPSSSGKTTFAHRLCTQLWVKGAKPIYLGTDDYYMDRDKVPFEPDGTQNFENLSSIDVELFNTQMKALLAGEEVDIPRFDFKLGRQVFGERKIKALPDQPIVIEGIHGLNDAMTPDIPQSQKFKIYISPLTQLRVSDHKRVNLTDIRKIRRIVRDASHRGWDAKQTIEAWAKVREGEDKNIFPYSQKADAVFNSCLIYELAALKKYAKPLLLAISEDDECYTEAHRLLHMLNYVDELPDDSAIVSNSILREFIGGSTVV